MPYEEFMFLCRILAENVSRKYLTLLLNAMSRCTFFLAAEPSVFGADDDLVHRFCVATLEECVKVQTIDRLLVVARKICSSLDLSWEGSTRLLLDLLKCTTDSVVCLKADLPKAVNDFLVFVAYVSRCFLSVNRDGRVGASVLLFKAGSYFSEVSSPIASVHLLYATGLYFSAQQMESDVHLCISEHFLNDEKYLEALNEALCTLAQFFYIINGGSIPLDGFGMESSLAHQGHSKKKHNDSQSRDNISLMAYLDSLEFVCKVLLQHTNAVWKNFSEGKAICYSGNLTYVLTALHQFIDSSLMAHSCAKMSSGDKERLHEHRGTLLNALVSAIKISFATSKAVEKSLSSTSHAISSSCLMFEDIKILISILGNIGVTLYNIRQFDEAPKVLELCCQTVWVHVRRSYCRLSEMGEGNGISEVLPKDTLKDIIVDAFTRIAKMVDVLHRCGAKVTREIVVKSLLLLVDGDMSEYLNSSLILIKLWVKITCKDFMDDQDVAHVRSRKKDMARAPLLFDLLLAYPSPLPMKLLGLIVEQEELAFGSTEPRGAIFCAQMQTRIIDILLDEMYSPEEYFLERSRVLVRKAGVLRSSGMQNISSCLESLSEAISLLLKNTALDLSQRNPTVINQLATAHCLHAHCAQEGNLDDEVVLGSARSALDLWSEVGSFVRSSPGMISQQKSRTIVPLLCSLIDLLAIKGCFELQLGFCKQTIVIWKQESLPVENIFSFLFTSGRLSHACCHLPMDQEIISNLTLHFGIDCHCTEFWRNCFKGDHPSLSMFLQRMFPTDLVLSQSYKHSNGKKFSFSLSVDEVDKVASSLVSEVASSGQPIFIAACLYYDLSEKLLSGGHLSQAFSYGKEALNLRKKLLKKEFKLNLGRIGSGASQCCGEQGFVCLEACGSTVTEIWPDSTRSTSMKDSFLTPWNILRCYLESILQVALMHELTGNDAEAEVLVRTGKEISHFHKLPVFRIAFTSLLGQLYRKRQLWDEAEGELKYARDFLAENDSFISCKLCRLTLKISLDMKDGDKKHSTGNFSGALVRYQAAMDKLNSTEFLAGTYDGHKPGGVLCNKDYIGQTRCEACKHGKEPLVAKDDVLPTCISCKGKSNCYLNGSDCSKDDICDMFGCWNCLLVKSLNSGSIQNILQFRFNCVLQRYLLPLLLKKARAMGAHNGEYGAHEIYNIYWQCISLLYFRSLPQGCYRTYGPHLIALMVEGNIGDYLSLERAEILHSMSLFLLKGFLPEQSRDVCCTFSSVGMSCVVPWLLKAFVLSRESPSLFQKVCRLLACVFLLSKVNSSIQLPLWFQKSTLSVDGWVAYFHQISIGSLSCHDLASLQVLLREMVRKGPLADSGDETDECVSKFPRLAGIEHIEKHVSDFFHKLPDVPTVCISMLGDDYVDVFGENLLEDDCVDVLGENVAPSFFPAWMLISRFHSTNKPTAMLLPVGTILEEMQSEGSSIKDLGNPMSVSDKKWQCPWGYAITDHVAPTFRSILEENFMSLSSATLTINDGQANCVRWWAHRMKLNNYLDKLLKDMEELWLGPWKCLLLGHQPSNEHIEAASSSIVTCLEEFKLEVNPELIKAVLGGAVSVDEVHECLYQLILYKGYVGRGQCCEKDRLRSFSSWQIDTKALETLKCLIENTVDGLLESADRGPVILILDINVQMLPWENLPVLRNQEIYRMPSMGNIFLALTRCNNHYKDGNVVAPRFPAIDPFNTFYLLNPNGDLSSTQKEFEQFFRNYKWKGNAGHNPTSEELVMALANYDLFLYFGHGSGAKYINLKEIEKLNNCASAVLMGCSSGALHCKGSYAPHGAPLSYLSGGSPAVVANLWDVSDKDIDRFSKALLHSWLREDSADDSNCSQCSQLTQEFESINIGVEGNDRRNVDTKRCSCRQIRVASNLSKPRSACRLPHLIGASPVCYGVPTIIRR
uniref:separase n=1 Tax=Setaria viridis TaxID=4556 RepID=A0A4U6V7A5_SETVI|nr:hypothetical protein SEVIR_4G292500v2 [Setaria viridis]